MERITIHTMPKLRRPAMIVTFAGWPDAGEVGSCAVKYLIRKLPAEKFAEMDPEDFYDFTRQRPFTLIRSSGERVLRWPANEFYYWRNPSGERDEILFLGTEPNLRWRAYLQDVMDLAEQCDVSAIVSLGGAYDAVSHRGQPKVTGMANEPGLARALRGLHIPSSTYQGPSSIHSALRDACAQRGIPHASVWGNPPQYVQVLPNVKVCHAVLHKLTALLGIEVDLKEMRAAASALDQRVEEALAKDPELRAFVERLEQEQPREEAPEATEEAAPSSGEGLSTEAIVQELEEFLKRQQRRNGPESEGQQ